MCEVGRCCVIFVIVVFITSCATGETPERKLDRLIGQSLPVGSSASQVVAFLDSQGIEEFGYQEGEEPVFTPTALHPKPEIKRFVLARQRSVKKSLLNSWDLYIVLYFDREEKLTDYRMKRIGSGL